MSRIDWKVVANRFFEAATALEEADWGCGCCADDYESVNTARRLYNEAITDLAEAIVEMKGEQARHSDA